MKEWLKAKLALTIITVLWTTLIFRNLFSLLYSYKQDKKQGTQLKRGLLYSKVLGQDLYVNTQIGGYFKTTISSELGNQQKTSKSGKVAAKIVDWLFELAGDEPNHCSRSIEAEDEHWFDAKQALVDFGLWIINGAIFYSIIIGIILL